MQTVFRRTTLFRGGSSIFSGGERGGFYSTQQRIASSFRRNLLLLDTSCRGFAGISKMTTLENATSAAAERRKVKEKEKKKESIPHTERTAHEPREKALIPVKIQKVEQISPKIRLFQLGIPMAAQPVKFLPGQWLDVWCPGIPKAGGFTLTSSPSRAQLRHPGGVNESPYMELAVQRSPENPPAAWLWGEHSSQDAGAGREVVLGDELQVRLGGSFTWPPPGLDEVDMEGLEKVVFVAGGVGINPLVSMVGYIAEQCAGGREHGFEVHFLYSVKDPGEDKRASEILFLERVARIFERGEVKGRLRLFLTGGGDGDGENKVFSEELGKNIPFERRRVVIEDVVEAVGRRKDKSVVYVCGVPGMTDEFVHELRNSEGIGMSEERVLCEKWW